MMRKLLSFLLACAMFSAPVAVAAERSEVLYERTTLHNTYAETPVTGEEIDLILHAGFSAPTGGGQRSLEFFVVTDRDVMAAMREGHPYSNALATAPLVIVIAGNEEIARYPELHEMDSGLAAMAMMVQASDLGLSSCVLSISPQEERIAGVSNALKLPENDVPVLMVAFGHPGVDAQTSASVEMYRDSQVHWNSYQAAEPEEESVAGLAENEYLGISNAGMGGKVTVKITVDGGKLTGFEVAEQNETPGISDPALNTLPAAILEAQSADVDTIAGATITSNAIKEAAADAMAKAGL